MSTEINRKKIIVRFAVILMTFLAFFCIGIIDSHAASAPTAKGQVNEKKGIYLRARASNSAKKVVKVKNDAKLTIIKEVYLKNNNTNTKYKWYYVKASGKKGYIPASKVDGLKYSAVDGVTTDDLNYRVGPDTKMKRVGTLKDNSSLDVVLKANVKGNKTMWYKIKKGKKYYYVCSEWAEIEKPETTTTTPQKSETKDSTPTFEIKDLTYPVTLLEKMSFALKGKITCSHKISSAKFGIQNSSGKWIASDEVTVNANVFNVAAVDNNIKFGTLDPGKYTYVGILKVNGKEYKKVSKAFTVKKSKGAQKLTTVALQLAWPYGTEKSVYGSEPTAAYAAALDQVYPKHNTWGTGPNTGASCDVFVGTVCRFSGVDADMPRTLNKMWEHCEGSDKWVKLDYHCEQSELQSGDIIFYHYATSGQHVCMYVEIDGKGYVAEANYPSKLYGFINPSIRKIMRMSDKKDLAVFRAAD